MRLIDYKYAEDIDKKQWLNSIQMQVGLKYFGGKNFIGKYIFNNIFNLSVEMEKQGKRPDIFIDAFTGGGKIGLSVPYGWYDTIVINDINYGVYNYYKYCQENHIALIYMIEKIGDLMNRDMFHIAAYIRNFGHGAKKWDKKIARKMRKLVVPAKVTKAEEIDPLVAAALTYWVTSGAFNGMTEPRYATYNLTRKIGEGDQQQDDKAYEQQMIQKLINRAKKRIPKLHEKLNSQHYIIENLDYKELIKKYNGFKYTDLLETKHKAITENKNKNKLWYFDPPYHPWCLHAGKDAPYANTFDEELANEMIDILHGDKETEYGPLEYFIKSDYDPNEALARARADKDNQAIDDEKRDWYKMLIKLEDSGKKVSTLFKKLEIYPFCKICVGSFDKGVMVGKEEINERSVGQEYIWCRGFPEGYENIEGIPAK